MEQRDYSKAIPIEPPEDLIPWLKKQGRFQKHLLRYKAARVLEPLSDEWIPMVELKCSGCGGTMYADRVDADGCGRGYTSAPFGYHDPETHRDVISGNTVKCPMCGCTVKVYHTGSFRYGVTLEEAWPMTVTRLEDKLLLTGWYASQHISHDCEEIISARHFEAYVVEEKKVVRLMGYLRCLSSVSFFTGWEQRKICLDVWGEARLIYPWDPAILKGTTAENSKLDLYLKCDGTLFPVSYMRLWRDRPTVENLLVQGAGNILADMITRDCKPVGYGWNGEVNIPHLKDVNWRDKRPAQMLRLDKHEFKCAVQQKWSLAELEVYRSLRDRDGKVDCTADMLEVRKVDVQNVKYLIERQVYGSVMRSVRYLVKQKKKDAITLVDYWNLLNQNGEDEQDATLRYPQNLKRAHDQQAERQKLDKKRGYPEAFMKRNEHLSMFAYEADGFLIRPVSSAEELFNEGKKLSHCVYSYLTRHVRGETAILLIRRTDAPDEPFFTLELNEAKMHVVQNRGKHNCSRTPEVQAFEEKWLEWAKAQKAKERKESAA